MSRHQPLHKTEPEIKPGWQAAAACADLDPELFFPIGEQGPARKDAQTAKRVCARCPVSRVCLAYALRSGQTSGIWGGMTERERAALKRRSGQGISRP